MKRIFWTVGMAIIGFGFGWNAQGIRFEIGMVVVSTVWAACIGFGLGSIFSNSPSGKKRVIYWSFTLALVGAFLGPLVSVPNSFAQEVVATASGACAGLILGLIIGFAQLRRSSVKHQA